MAKTCSPSPAVDEDVDDVDHALWCYAKMDDPRASPETAPSRGAWAMLCWAREERSRFYTSAFPRALLAQVKDEIEEVERYKRGELTDEELADSDEMEMQRAWLGAIGATDDFISGPVILGDAGKWASEGKQGRAMYGIAVTPLEPDAPAWPISHYFRIFGNLLSTAVGSLTSLR